MLDFHGQRLKLSIGIAVSPESPFVYASGFEKDEPADQKSIEFGISHLFNKCNSIEIAFTRRMQYVTKYFRIMQISFKWFLNL